MQSLENTAEIHSKLRKGIDCNDSIRKCIYVCVVSFSPCPSLTQYLSLIIHTHMYVPHILYV